LARVQPHVACGERLAATDPAAAYLCFKFAVVKGMGVPHKSPAATALLSALMTRLEESKAVAVAPAAAAVLRGAADAAFADVGRTTDAAEYREAYAFAYALWEVLADAGDAADASRYYDEWKVGVAAEAPEPEPEFAEYVFASAEGAGGEVAPAEGAVAAVETETPPPIAAATPPTPRRLLTTLPRTRRDDALEVLKFASAAVEDDEVALAVSRLEHALRLMCVDAE